MNAPLKVVTPDSLIATNSEAAFVGAVVYWRLPGSIRLDTLQKAWSDEKLDASLLPKVPSAQVALTRAVDDVAKGDRFKRRIKEGGYVLVQQSEKGGLEFNALCRVTLDATDEIVLEEQVDGSTSWTAITAHPMLGKVTAAYESHKDVLASRDIGGWLCDKVMSKLGATTLRESGGVYFVPRAQVALLKRIVDVVKSVSSYKVYQIKAMTGDEAVEAVLDAIVVEAGAAADAVEVALAQGHGAVEGEDSEVKSLGPRALETRAERCREMVTKVRDYEVLLGKMMPKVIERLEDLKIAAMEASLAAKAE